VLVGQLVLIYQPDLIAAVSPSASHVRPGGAVAFVELNLRPDGSQVIYWPQTLLWARGRGWIRQGFERTHYSVELQLPSIPRRGAIACVRPLGATVGRTVHGRGVGRSICLA
jgi:hypothetical protein